MERLKNFTLLLAPEAHRELKLLSVRHGVRLGDAIAGLLVLAMACPAEQVARALAGADGEEGALVPEGQETEHVAQQRAACGENF